MSFYDKIEDQLDYDMTLLEMEGYDLLVFLENESDKGFWSTLFYESDINKKIQYNSYSKTENGSFAQGKKQILKYKDAVKTKNGKALICVDSDFDYINSNSDINENPFILQTYMYSIESYSCCPKSLNNLCRRISLGDSFDFEVFFKNYSEIVFELFILDVLLENKGTDIKKYYSANIDNLNNNGEILLEVIKNDINSKIIELKNNFNIDNEDIISLKNKIQEDTLLNDSFIHLYINGHKIFELTKNIIKKLQDNEHSVNINKASHLKGKHKGDKVKELNNNKSGLANILRQDFDTCDYELSFKKIIDDIKGVVR